ncbi:TetR/AcrR family transcriptional regulator [Oscillospiraceae bacterium LTW-04]|nr:TetR/AcrR family transcriptional regulator [Oscillospiraceae bacterium MB24-C1]
MDETKIREPQQKRAIEKKNKIILAGLSLFSKKGYHNTNTVEIAKLAGVSTGALYSYFKDKKAIYIEAFDYFLNEHAVPILDKVAQLPSQTDLTVFVEKIVDAFLVLYKDTSNAMLELTNTMSIDEDISRYFCDYESWYFLKFAEVFKKHGIYHDDILERIYLAYTLLDLLGLEQTNYHHKFIRFEVLKAEVVSTITNLLTAE